MKRDSRTADKSIRKVAARYQQQPSKQDSLPNETPGVRGRIAPQTAGLRQFLSSKLPRHEAPQSLLTAIKEKISRL